MNEERLKEALKFLKGIEDDVKTECEKLLDFISEFAKRYDEEKRKLPYHLNVIDELHINENAHSRILMKLLCYQNDKGEYEILQSLLEYMKSKKEAFSRISIENPTITQEEQRIDLWVRDGYAIIFENKIYNAKDQEEQICRYIDKTKDEGYEVENIYVIYLSQDGKEPEDQTWRNKEKDYKEDFKDRYLNLSFRYDIRRWLREHVLPDVRHKDDYLKCALKQYIDYLDGLFNLRTIQKPMIMKLNNFIKDTLNLHDKSPQGCLEILKEKKEGLQELTSVIENLINEYIQKTAEEIIKPQLKSFLEREDFNGNLHLEESSFYVNVKGIDIEVSNDSWNKCFIQIGLYKDKIFGGLRYKDKKDPLSPNELDQLKNKLADWKDNDSTDARWTYFVDKGYFDKDYLNCSHWNLETWHEFERGIECLIQYIYENCEGIEL